MPRCRLSCEAFCRKLVKPNLQVLLTLARVVVGIAMGFGLRGTKLNAQQQRFLALPGKLFIRALNAMVIPVITTSIICGFASLKGASKGKMLLKTLMYYMTTSVMAALTGVLLSMAIKPGVGIKAGNATALAINSPLSASRLNGLDSVYDLLVNLVPDNIVKATMYSYRTERTVPNNGADLFPGLNISANSTGFESYETVATASQLAGPNFIGLIALSMLFGSVLSNLGQEGRVIIAFTDGVLKLSTRIIVYLMWLAPIGLAFLIASSIAKVKNLEDTFGKLGMYCLTVVMGLAIHLCVTLSLIYFAFVRKNPFKYFSGMVQAILTMMGTASSSVTLPVTMKCVEENKVDKRITRFLLPIGATVNMDGTALYETVSAIFVAQLNGYRTSFGTLISISFTATAASVGAAPIPNAAIIVVLMVLQACGLPTTDWYLLVSVEWILSRLQGVVNILGDSVGAAVVESMSRAELTVTPAAEQEKLNEDKLDREDTSV